MNLCKEYFYLKSLGVLLLGAAITSCSPSETATPAKSDKSGAVVLTGSNTIGEELAPRLIAEYKKDHPAATFQTEFKGTGYGVAAMLGGLSDIAAASRVLTTNEMELARTRNINCNDYTIGSYSVAVIVNLGNSVGNLTRDQVRDVFTGVIQNWKEVGGSDGPIHLYIRDPISGTHLGFRELAMENKPYGASMKTFPSYAAIVQEVAGDANGIGYSSIELSTKPNVKGVSIGGIAPTSAMVNQGQYPYARVLHLFTDKDKEAPAAHDFIQFVQSSTGQKLLDQLGFIPHS
jgi:phosphate transport system substrate-binding protein